MSRTLIPAPFGSLVCHAAFTLACSAGISAGTCAQSISSLDEMTPDTEGQAGSYGNGQVGVAGIVRLRIQSGINQFSDETLVVFSVGEPGTTSEDVPKFIFAHPNAPQIATIGDSGEMIAINAYGPYTQDISIPVTVNVAVNGNYSITTTGLADAGLSCMHLEDLHTNTVILLEEGVPYTFAALASDDPAQARFLLHATAPLPLVPSNATCSGRDDGSAVLTLASGPADVLWMDADGAIMLEQNAVMPGTAQIMALAAGEYGVRVNGDVQCGTMWTNFTIGQPEALDAVAVTEPASCPGSPDGTIDLEVRGGQAPYVFGWSNGSVEEDLVVGAGTYSVAISDVNGCALAPQEYVVGAGEGPDAGISVESQLVAVGEPVLFAPNTLDGVTNAWDFGDGTTSNDLEGVHAYSVPGTYTITLHVDDGNCVSTASIQLVVETTTHIPTVVGRDLNVWLSGDQIVVDHNFNGQEPLFIRIFNTGGQLEQDYRMAPSGSRILLPTNELSAGIWMVRISSGVHMRTFSLPIVR